MVGRASWWNFSGTLVTCNRWPREFAIELALCLVWTFSRCPRLWPHPTGYPNYMLQQPNIFLQFFLSTNTAEKGEKREMGWMAYRVSSLIIWRPPWQAGFPYPGDSTQTPHFVFSPNSRLQILPAKPLSPERIFSRAITRKYVCRCNHLTCF